jgi:phosphoribosyl 1,2-cyclic phosphodiesterase
MSKPGIPLRVTFRGVRGSIPAPGMTTARYGGNTSCVEVRAGDQILILDAGTGIRALGSELIAEFGAKPIEATLLISHTHWDHIQGLPFFVPAYSPENRIRVMAAKGAGVTVEHGLHNQMDPVNFPVGFDQVRGLTKLEELASDNTALGAFTIGVTRLNHPGGCAGFRIEANGASLAYLPDHEPFAEGESVANNNSAKARTDALIEFIRGVDLLILDTQYTEAEYQQRRGWGHGCLPDSVFLAIHAGVRQLAFFHHDPGHSDDQIDAMVQTARDLAGEQPLVVTGASENEPITVSAATVPLFRAPLPSSEASAA